MKDELLTELVIFLLIMIPLALVGCIEGQQPGLSCQTIHNTKEEQITKSGLALLPSSDMYLSIQDMDRIYKETEQCTGLSAPPPTVRYDSFHKLGIGSVWAVYMAVSSSILINSDDQKTALRDCDTDEQAFRHESVHHLLYMNGLAWHDGESSLFTKCGQGVSISN